MSFYLYALKTRLKLSFNKFFLATILLYVVFVLITVLSYNEPNAGSTNIGFVYEENEFTTGLIGQFNYYGGEFFTTVKYENKEDLERDVAKNTIDCGYVLPTEFNSKKESIEYISSNKTITGTYSNLLLSSIYLQYDAGTMGYNAIKKISDEDVKIIKEKVTEANQNYLEDAPFMSYNYEGLNGHEIVTNNTIYIILYGIIGLFLTLFGLLFYLEEVFEENSVIYLSLKNLKNRLFYYLGNLTAYFLILFVFSFLNVFFIKYNFLGTFINLQEILVLFLFSLLIASLVFTLGLIKNTNISSLFIIFYFVSACIFGNVFVEFNSIVKFLYPTYYFKEAMLEFNLSLIAILILIFISNIFNYFVIKKVKFRK